MDHDGMMLLAICFDELPPHPGMGWWERNGQAGHSQIAGNRHHHSLMDIVSTIGAHPLPMCFIIGTASVHALFSLGLGGLLVPPSLHTIRERS